MRDGLVLGVLALLAAQTQACGQTGPMGRSMVDGAPLRIDMPITPAIRSSPFGDGTPGFRDGTPGLTVSTPPLGRSADGCPTCVTPGMLGGGLLGGQLRAYRMIVPRHLDDDGSACASECLAQRTVNSGSIALFNDLNRPSEVRVTLAGASVPLTLRLGPGEIRTLGLAISGTAQVSVTVASGASRSLPAPVTVNPGNLYRLSIDGGVLFLRPA